MSKGLLFWILMLIWFVFGLWQYWGVLPVLGGHGLVFILLLLLGWESFGAPVK